MTLPFHRLTRLLSDSFSSLPYTSVRWDSCAVAEYTRARPTNSAVLTGKLAAIIGSRSCCGIKGVAVAPGATALMVMFEEGRMGRSERTSPIS